MEMKKPSHMLDLSSLEFAKAGHTMTNAKCNLPEGTFRSQAKGYEAIHVKPYSRILALRGVYFGWPGA